MTDSTTATTPKATADTATGTSHYISAGSALSAILENQGCTASDWNRVRLHPDTDYSLIRNTRFYGDVTVGLLSRDSDRPCGIFNAVIEDCTIGNGCYISSVRGALKGCLIADEARIVDVGTISFESSDAPCGIGTAVGVLDETGSRPVYIFPGLDAQLASLMVWKPRWTDDVLLPLMQQMWEDMPSYAFIGAGADISGVGLMHNVGVGAGVSVCGASRLVNGLIVNNSPTSRPFTYVGAGVDAENFIIEDARVDTGVTLRNCFVGQGTVLDKGFTAHDSLFFANCTCENGEACALFAAPYTVSMHKSSLLIGSMTSFMNAGSGTNSSNHKYKLGPVHWGIMERGIKTASDSYIMWGGRLGAFSMLMGAHKKHPDTSLFPFSYLFADPKGNTIVAPGLMLKSCGLARDAVKWPSRDNRKRPRLPQNDRIRFEVFNPVTVGAMMKAVAAIEDIIARGPASQDGYYLYNGLLFTGKALERGRELYTLAILRYLKGTTPGVAAPDEEPEIWIDLGGFPMPRRIVDKVWNAESVAEIRDTFDRAFQHYDEMEQAWKESALSPRWQSLMPEAEAAEERLAKMIEDDRAATLRTLEEHASFLRE